MNDHWLRRTAWVLALMAIGILLISAVLLYIAPDNFRTLNWLDNQVKAIVTLGAPILGLIIVIRHPRQRIGWLWLIYGLVIALRTLGHAIYFGGGTQPGGFLPLEYFLFWFAELATLISFICMILLMLWFPDGRLLSPRWRLLYIWDSSASGHLLLQVWQPVQGEFDFDL